MSTSECTLGSFSEVLSRGGVPRTQNVWPLLLVCSVCSVKRPGHGNKSVIIMCSLMALVLASYPLREIYHVQSFEFLDAM